MAGPSGARGPDCIAHSHRTEDASGSGAGAGQGRAIQVDHNVNASGDVKSPTSGCQIPRLDVPPGRRGFVPEALRPALLPLLRVIGTDAGSELYETGGQETTLLTRNPRRFDDSHGVGPLTALTLVLLLTMTEAGSRKIALPPGCGLLYRAATQHGNSGLRAPQFWHTKPVIQYAND